LWTNQKPRVGTAALGRPTRRVSLGRVKKRWVVRKEAVAKEEKEAGHVTGKQAEGRQQARLRM
jgi:hypothetical protein